MTLIRSFTLIALTASPVVAWENTQEWRFVGTEIQSFNHVVPDFDEDPEQLKIKLLAENGAQTTFSIEADNGVGDCVEQLGYAQGNPHVIMVLTANLNAQTLNGVTLAQCSTR
ncbi:hypothetical protein [Antarctobacter jejuensis]|uniref:hypothetical protein n=1 Tax=Antarctobacter jejuensis TaxID=1439938 RepID=UPI003FD1C602